MKNMKVKYCEKCEHYKRKAWHTSYKPASYHRIGVTHAYGFCEKWDARCLVVRDCKINKKIEIETRRQYERDII